MSGPALAGILILTIKPAGAFAFDVATFLVVIAMVSRMQPSPPTHDEASVSWSAIAAGFRFLKGKRTVQSVFAIDLNAMVFGFPMALFPAIAEKLGHGPSPGILGLLYAAPAVGSFLATAFSGRAKHVRRQGRAINAGVSTGSGWPYGRPRGCWHPGSRVTTGGIPPPETAARVGRPRGADRLGRRHSLRAGSMTRPPPAQRRGGGGSCGAGGLTGRPRSRGRIVRSPLRSDDHGAGGALVMLAIAIRTVS